MGPIREFGAPSPVPNGGLMTHVHVSGSPMWEWSEDLAEDIATKSTLHQDCMAASEEFESTTKSRGEELNVRVLYRVP